MDQIHVTCKECSTTCNILMIKVKENVWLIIPYIVCEELGQCDRALHLTTCDIYLMTGSKTGPLIIIGTCTLNLMGDIALKQHAAIYVVCLLL